MLEQYGIENLLVCGVTTEVCVNTTVREANDRGYRCVVLSDGCASYFPEFHEMGLKMIKAQGGSLRLGQRLRQGSQGHDTGASDDLAAEHPRRHQNPRNPTPKPLKTFCFRGLFIQRAAFGAASEPMFIAVRI